MASGSPTQRRRFRSFKTGSTLGTYGDTVYCLDGLCPTTDPMSATCSMLVYVSVSIATAVCVGTFTRRQRTFRTFGPLNVFACNLPE